MDTGRRGILQAAGLALLAGGLNCSSTQAMEPVSRNPGKRIKLSIAAYSFRNELKAEPPQMTLHEGFLLESAWSLADRWEGSQRAIGK